MASGGLSFQRHRWRFLSHNFLCWFDTIFVHHQTLQNFRPINCHHFDFSSHPSHPQAVLGKCLRARLFRQRICTESFLSFSKSCLLFLLNQVIWKVESCVLRCERRIFNRPRLNYTTAIWPPDNYHSVIVGVVALVAPLEVVCSLLTAEMAIGNSPAPTGIITRHFCCEAESERSQYECRDSSFDDDNLLSFSLPFICLVLFALLCRLAIAADKRVSGLFPETIFYARLDWRLLATTVIITHTKKNKVMWKTCSYWRVPALDCLSFHLSDDTILGQ